MRDVETIPKSCSAGALSEGRMRAAFMLDSTPHVCT